MGSLLEPPIGDPNTIRTCVDSPGDFGYNWSKITIKYINYMSIAEIYSRSQWMRCGDKSTHLQFLARTDEP